MSSVEQPCYTIINFPTDGDSPNEMQLKLDLEKGDIKKKIEALKKTISMILAGEKIPGLLMLIIRFVLPLQDHTIKKLLLIFWEIVPKTTPDGKLMQEMILVCDAYRKDLQHPNEFIRGSTLRFLCKLKEAELLEPLMPTIRACLEHRHSYVRRNAVLAIFTIYRNFEHLIPDAPELIATFLENEQDMSCKRNAFLMLLHADQERALAYLSSRLDSIQNFGDILQLVIVELIYKVCHANPSERPRFIRCVYGLLSSSSSAVRYEAAGTLVTLSTAPAALKAAASCYIDLIVKESDNNVKLIVLDRLDALASSHANALHELAMDVLRVLAASDLQLRTHALNLALKLASNRQAEELVNVLRKEATRSQSAEHEDAAKYRQLLVKTLHDATIKFPEVSQSVGGSVLELVADGSAPAAMDALNMTRDTLRDPQLREVVYPKLLSIAPNIVDAKCARSAVWLIAHYADNDERAEQAIKLFEEVLAQEESTDESKPESETPRQLVTSDGTYATQSAFNLPQKNKSTPQVGLRSALLEGEPFSASCVCSALSRLSEHSPKLRLRAMALAATVLAHRSTNCTGTSALTSDDLEHSASCLLLSSREESELSSAILNNSKVALNKLLDEARAAKLKETTQDSGAENQQVPVEATVKFRQLSGTDNSSEDHDMFDLSLSKAVDGKGSALSSRRDGLSKVTQLTGFSDPVYAEAIVSVNQYDIVLDILLVNQTDDTLQSCTVELATLGELRLVERPSSLVLAPRDYSSIKAHVKVASTENGIIFGNIVYEVSGGVSGGGRGVVVLADIHVDIVDYIHPKTCSDAHFRRMWAELEWENKVSVNTNITDLKEYLDYLLSSTNMKCLTPEKALSGECGFMAANMYARSIFGEDALANLSIEKPNNKPDAPVVGHIRIRAKSQGMALSLGDKINLMQKATQQKHPTAAIPA